MHQGQKPQRKHEARDGLTVLELLVCIAIVAVLMGVALPALMQARELTRQSQCSNQLRQCGLALHQYHDHVRALPRAWGLGGADSRFAMSWASQILSELEIVSNRSSLQPAKESAMFASYQEAAQYQRTIFLCPSDIAEPAFELLTPPSNATDEWDALETRSIDQASRSLGYLPTSNYVAVYGTVEADDFEAVTLASGQTFGDGSIIHDRGVTLAELQRGTSNTLLVGERKMAMVPSTWFGVDLDGEDAACRLTGSAITRPNCEPCDECEFSSRHSGGSMFLWADGHVSLMTDSIDTYLYRQSAKRRTE